METLSELHKSLNSIVWGPVMLPLLVGTGLVLTVATRGVQFRRFGFALRQVLARPASSDDQGTVTPLQALATSLAATVGVGNIAGVSTAVFLGGPGALLWLLGSGIFGMATRFSEIAVALRFRELDERGVMRGGAMYVLEKHLGLKWLGVLFAIFTALAGFGIGNMTQANSVADVVQTSFGTPPIATGVVLCVLTMLVVLGGVQRIARVAQFIVPLMCGTYLLGGFWIVLTNLTRIPEVVMLIVSSAFSGHVAAGGFAGATVATAVRYGIARGLFSNEAGLGSAPMVHASARTDHSVRQACYGIVGVFVDTIIVCMVTGFAVLVTGAWQSGEEGASMATKAFEIGLPGEWGGYVVSLGIIFFAFSTLVGWAHYGETAVTYLFGARSQMPYRMAWVLFVYLGATGSLQTIWSVSDTMNGLMAIPNLIAVLGSIGLLRKLVKEFFEKERLAVP